MAAEAKAQKKGTTIDEGALQALKDQHGQVHLLEHMDVEVVVRRPNRAQWKRFRDQIFDDRKASAATEALLRDCVLHPDRQAFDAILEEYPGLAETFGKAVVELAGGSGTPEKKAIG